MRFFFIVLLMVLTPTAVAEDAKTIMWEELLPEGEIEIIERMMLESGNLNLGHNFDPESPFAPEQVGTFNTVPELDGQRIRMPGYIVPLEYDEIGNVIDFLLVPYRGACIHMPPPPPNQIVMVNSDEAMDYGAMWRPVWVSGVMKTERSLNNLGNTAYTLQLEGWEPYEN